MRRSWKAVALAVASLAGVAVVAPQPAQAYYWCAGYVGEPYGPAQCETWVYTSRSFDPSPPSSVTTSVASSGGLRSGQVRISWKAPTATGGYPIVGYMVRYSSDGGSTWRFANGGSKTTLTSMVVSGLTNGRTYLFKVASINTETEPNFGRYSSNVPAIPRTVPTAPRSLTATVGMGSGMVSLSWLGPLASNGSPITGYQVQRSNDGGSTWSTIANPSVRSFTTGGMTNGWLYKFRVLARNGAGLSVPSNLIAARPHA